MACHDRLEALAAQRWHFDACWRIVFEDDGCGWFDGPEYERVWEEYLAAEPTGDVMDFIRWRVNVGVDG